MATCIRQEVTTGVKPKNLAADWRKDKFLWKPTAEHYKGIVVLTLPIGDVKSVIVYDFAGKKIKTLAFRKHTGDEAPVGDAWADFEKTGKDYKKLSPKGIIVRITYKDKKIRNFQLSCPDKRSDGK